MEHLSKQQIILLALLVSFVSSIVTGISTVSLMSQDPQAVTQTINRVVERTIETVVPGGNSASVAIPTKEVTVVVREEEFVTKTVQEAHDTIVRIKNKKDGALLGIGMVISADGTIVADRASVAGAREYVGVYQGVEYPIQVLKQNKKQDIMTFTFKQIPLTINSVAFADSASIKAGQSVVAVSGTDRDVVSIGIISSIFESNDEAKTLYSIDTTIAQNSLVAGTPVFGLDAKLIALKIGKDENDADILMPITRVTAALAALSTTE